MGVPEASVDKDRPFARLICEVRLAWKVIDMIAELLPERADG
jgi:hypothetical protein